MTVRNDDTSYTKAELGDLNARYMGAPNTPIVGLTVIPAPGENKLGFDPRWNYTAKDIGGGMDGRAPGVKARVATQIWELGNSLDNIKTSPNLPNDAEAGQSMLDCVSGYLKSH